MFRRVEGKVVRVWTTGASSQRCLEEVLDLWGEKMVLAFLLEAIVAEE